MIRVGIVGGTGALGKEVIIAIDKSEGVSVGAVLTHNNNKYYGKRLSDFIESQYNNLIVTDDIVGNADNMDLLIDCSNAAVVENNKDIYAKLKKPLIIATTGLTEDTRNHYKNLSSKMPICICSNFSVVCNIFYDIIEYASDIIKQSDIYITESHGKKKKDAPSGTAKTLREIIAMHNENIEIPVHSIRAGNLTGWHTVSFVDEQNNELEFTYSSGSRNTYAVGMILAIKYLYAQKNGMHDFRDIIKKS